MKTFLCLAPLAGLAAFLAACGPSPLGERYGLVFPAPPAPWAETLGPPRWRVEWRDGGDSPVRTADTSGALDIGLPAEWSGAVLAWPFWPERGLPPGAFYPAGGIFPFDAAGNTLTLSWEGGPAAVFFRELRRAAAGGGAHAGARRPEYFDWPRFRALLQNDAPENVRADPWLADWKAVAEAAVRSGFSKTLVKAAPRTETAAFIPRDGPWLGPSPFDPLRLWEPGERIIPLTARPQIYVCPGGILTLSAAASSWRPFPPEGP